MPRKSIFADLSTDILAKRKKTKQPSFVPVMLAVLTKAYFNDPQWIFEHKFDGERCLAVKKSGSVTLLSRNKKIMNSSYPELVAALLQQDADNFIIDGEIVAYKNGISSFELLQPRINLTSTQSILRMEEEVPIIYEIFDVLYAGDFDVTELPLIARKSILEKLLTYSQVLSFSNYAYERGYEYYKKACALHWEGLIAKKADSPYISKRSSSWLKFKCTKGQELVIGGYTEPHGSRTHFGALLVGYYDKGRLKYAGKVGTGFNQTSLSMLGKKLRTLTSKKCPFDDYDGPQKEVHWVKPELVGEFQFAEWTRAGRLRVPRYKGLRTDKKAQDVVKEE